MTHLYTFLTSRARGGASASGPSLSGAPRSCWGFSNRVLQTALPVTWSLVIFILSETLAWPGVRAAGGRAVRSVRADAAQLLTSAVTCPAPGSLTRHFSIQTELLQRKVTLLDSFRIIILFSGLSAISKDWYQLNYTLLADVCSIAFLSNQEWKLNQMENKKYLQYIQMYKTYKR